MDSRDIHNTLTESELTLIRSAIEASQPRGVNIDGIPGSEVDVPGTALALPLYHGDECAGAFYIQSPQTSWLALGDVLFLTGATQYLGIILGR